MEQSWITEQHLINTLRECAIVGTFEAHITIDAPDANQRERFRSLCDNLGVKCVLIELPEGVTRSQPMTASYHHGSLSSVMPEVANICRQIRDEGFVVTRLKLEAVAQNDGVPVDDKAALQFPPSNYFEFHAKLLLDESINLDALRELCGRHDARLSGNALKHRADGTLERFVTMRVYAVGRCSAFARFEQLLAVLAAAGYKVVHQLREYSIFDSAVTLDAGWIAVPKGASA